MTIGYSSRLHVVRRPARRASRDRAWPDFAIGIDLGQVRDYTALVLLQRIEPVDNPSGDGMLVQPHYHLRQVKRFPRRTETPAVITYLENLMNRPTLKGRVALIADASGMGGPIVQQMKRHGLGTIPMIITGGAQANGYNVPKANLVMRLKLLLEQRRLKIPMTLKLLRELVEEFTNFKMGYTPSRHATYSAASGYHDDIIIALALACNYFERRPAPMMIHATILPGVGARVLPEVNLDYWIRRQAAEERALLR